MRALLLLILVLAVWLSWRTNKAREQREAVATVQKFGGWVHYEDNYVKSGPSAPVWLRQLLGDEYVRVVAHVMLFSDRPRIGLVGGVPEAVDKADWKDAGPVGEVLSKLRSLPSVRIIHLGAACELTDADIAHLSGLPDLRDLTVDKSRLSDEGLKYLARLPNIEYLTLTGHRFTDEGLAHLRQTAHLKVLWLESDVNEITDAGLEALKGLKGLEVLDLSGSKVTDEGLVYLKAMPNLKEVRLRGTQITDAGWQKLQAAMPKLKVIH